MSHMLLQRPSMRGDEALATSGRPCHGRPAATDVVARSASSALHDRHQDHADERMGHAAVLHDGQHLLDTPAAAESIERISQRVFVEGADEHE